MNITKIRINEMILLPMNSKDISRKVVDKLKILYAW
jgi:hypothetical protein